MAEVDNEKLDYLRRHARLNLIKYILLKRIIAGKKELPKEFESILEYEYYLRFNELQLKNCGNYLDSKETCGIKEYTENKMKNDMERELKLKK